MNLRDDFSALYCVTFSSFRVDKSQLCDDHLNVPGSLQILFLRILHATNLF